MVRWWDREERIAVAADRWLARLHRDSSPATMARYRRWRDRDPRHAAAIAGAETVWRAMGRVSPAAIGEARTDHQARSPTSPTNVRVTLAVAATLVLVLLGAVALHLLRPRVQVEVIPTQFAARDGRLEVPLADGSVVTLDRGASIAVALADRRRDVVLLSGRARFRVAHDPTHPFVVTAGDRTVTAIGTIFDVIRAPDRMSVTLLEGRVEVARKAAVAPVVRLAAGQQLEVTGANTLRVEPTPSGPDWTHDLQLLDGLSLAQILARANRVGSIPILLADPALAPSRVQGRLATHDTRALAEQLAAALDLELAETPQGYVLRPRH